ncbi:MAG: GyrI-like domain-containing protein [Amphiplicatus sp.]
MLKGSLYSAVGAAQPSLVVESCKLLLAGFQESYTPSARGGIPAQWRRFAFHIGAVPGQIGSVTYGAILLERGERNVFTYMSAVEVAERAVIPRPFVKLRIDAPRFAVFRHNDNVITIHETVRAAYSAYPRLFEGKRPSNVDFLERYDERFDLETGDGGVDIMIPLID